MNFSTLVFGSAHLHKKDWNSGVNGDMGIVRMARQIISYNIWSHEKNIQKQKSYLINGIKYQRLEKQNKTKLKSTEV